MHLKVKVQAYFCTLKDQLLAASTTY